MALGYVRPARPGDAADIARIQLVTWRTAYRRVVPREILAELDVEFLRGRWAEAIAAPPSAAHRVLVAVEQADREHTVGFAAIGPADETSLAPDEAEAPTGVGAFTDLLVEPRWGRRGHGSRLLAAAVAHWRDDGYRRALAWAFEADPAMRKFLESAGWEADGATRSLDMADVLVPQLRLHVGLTD